MYQDSIYSRMERQQIIQERKTYYSNITVLFEIIKCLQHRELCFITQKGEPNRKTIRYLTAFKVDFLRTLLNHNQISFFDNLINIYHSSAVLNRYPYFSLNLDKRYEDKDYEGFNKNYDKYVIGCNFFIDIDGKEDYETALKEMREIKRLFDEFYLPYYVISSSFKGFHIIIPAQYLPEEKINNLLITIDKVIYNIAGIYDYKTIDLGITDLKRVSACPYSYKCDGAVCLPLDDKQIESFSKDIIKMKNVLKMNLRDRGLLIRKHGLSDEELKKNVIRFFKEFL